MSPNGPTPPARVRLTSGTVARAALVILALWALFNLLYVGRVVLFATFVAVLVAAFLSIFVDPLERRFGLPRAAGAALTLIVIGGLLAGLAVLAWPTLSEQLRLIRLQLPAFLAKTEAAIASVVEDVAGRLGNGDMTLEDVGHELGERVPQVVGRAIPIVGTVAGAVGGAVLVLFVGVFMTIERRTLAAGLVALVPPDGRTRVAGALVDAAATLRRWILGTSISMLSVGVMSYVGLWLLDVPAALALGLIAGVLTFVPIFGPLLSAVPAIAIALIMSPADAVWVVLLYIGIQQIEGNLITPLVMKGIVDIPATLSVLWQSLMALAFGFLGLFVAVPLLAVTMVLVRRLYVAPMDEAEATAQAPRAPAGA